MVADLFTARGVENKTAPNSDNSITDSVNEDDKADKDDKSEGTVNTEAKMLQTVKRINKSFRKTSYFSIMRCMPCLFRSNCCKRANKEMLTF